MSMKSKYVSKTIKIPKEFLVDFGVIERNIILSNLEKVKEKAKLNIANE